MFNDKAPYLLTILFASFAWTISQISTDFTKGPVLEISHKLNKNDKAEVIYTVTNISRDNLFNKLEFKILADKTSGATCSNNAPRLIIPSPYDPLENASEPTCKGKKATFPPVSLHPGAKVELIVSFDKQTKTNIYVKNDKAIRVLDSSLETKIIKNRFHILIGLFLLWVFGIVFYVFAWIKINSTSK